MSTQKTTKKKQAKRLLTIDEIKAGFDLMGESAFRSLFGWMQHAAKGDEFTKPNKSIQQELSRFLEVIAAYSLKYRKEGREYLSDVKPTTTIEQLEALAGDYRINP